MTFRAIFLFLPVFAIVHGNACQRSKNLDRNNLSSYFKPLTPCDTLHLEIRDDADTLIHVDTIPNRLFFKEAPAAMLAEIDYLADSAQALVLGRGQFNLDEHFCAYWVEIRQFWFQHQSLLLFDKQRKTFTGRITVAEWYGGDGGQVLIGSWMFDWNGDGNKDLLRLNISHSMTPGEDEPVEHTATEPALLLWRNGRFEAAAIRDTASVLQRFPILSYW